MSQQITVKLHMVEFKTNQQTSGFVLNSTFVRVVTYVLFAGFC